MKSSLIKVLALALVLLMVVPFFAACKKNTSTETTASDTTVNPDGTDTPYTGGDTLTVGYSLFSSKFSPFFAKTQYDMDVANMTQVSLLNTDREGNVILNGIEGETIAYNGIDYTYYGIADCVVTKNADDTVTYAFNMRDDVKFSDGVSMTADDAIFSMYVLSDPSYDGSSTFYALPIKGMTEYRTGVTKDIYLKYEAIADKILTAGQSNTTYTDFSKAQADAYWGDCFEAAGLKFTQEIIDYCVANYGSYGPSVNQDEVALGMYAWGFANLVDYYTVDNTDGTYGFIANADSTKGEYGANAGVYAAEYGTTHDVVQLTVKDDKYYYNDGTMDVEYTGSRYSITTTKLESSDDIYYDLDTQFPTVEDYWTCIKNTYGTDCTNGAFALDREKAGSSIIDFMKSVFISTEGPKDSQAGGAITNISGIVKTGTYTFEITTESFDATTIYGIGTTVTPLHYYGSKSLYDYDNDKFGFTKGDLSTVKAKTTTPLGAGAYKFVSFENGVVTFVRNDIFYKGTPKITNILFRETNDGDKVSGVKLGNFDVTDPSLSDAAVSAIKEANSNSTLTGNVITTNLVDNLGYGYIGINAANVKVGDDSSSDASKALRSAFATVLAIHRDTAINSYYGDRAAVIQYPISNTSWAAPRPSDEGYRLAYSIDVDGKDIYTTSMTEQQKFDAALDAAIGFFKAAGYTWNESTGKFTAAPTGAKMIYTVIIPGDGLQDHPSYQVLSTAKEDLAKIGITLDINDPADSNELWTALEAGTAEMWAAAWQATSDPDMYQIYHSNNIIGKVGSTNSNHYSITDSELDQLIMDARTSADQSFRKATYKSCLDIIMEWAVEVPVYQRKNAIIFNSSSINFDTLTPDITTFWGWMNDIENLEMN